MEDNFEKAVATLDSANFIYVIGNGGAASLADHLACDLIKNAGRRATSLCCNNALVTAIGNDLSYGDVFREQLKVMFDFGRDVLVALSTSGRSGNVVAAARFVLESGGKVIAITGKSRESDGGELLGNYATVTLRLDADSIQECEDMMAELCHRLYGELARGKPAADVR